MKNILIILFIAGFISSFSQDSTYFDDEDYNTIFNDSMAITGFGGPIFGFSKINSDFAFLTGGGGAILFGDNFFFGGYGMGMSNKVEIDSAKYKGNYLTFANGGLWLGYVFLGSKTFHPAISCLAGWGSVTLSSEYGHPTELKNVYVITPGVDLEINLSNYIRLDIGLYYRLISEMELEGFSKDDFSYPEAHITFKIGRY